jgi:hypothetical protein
MRRREFLNIAGGPYGFISPRNGRGLVSLEQILSGPVAKSTGDDRRIAVLARACHGASIDSVRNGNGEYVEPKK